MRSKLLGLFLGLGMVAVNLAPAAACMYNNTTADSDQAAPAQTAQSDAQPPAQRGTD
jgi:hypothetical protein